MTAIAKDEKKSGQGKKSPEASSERRALPESKKGKVKEKSKAQGKPAPKPESKGAPKTHAKAKVKGKPKAKSGAAPKRRSAVAGPEAKLKKLLKSEEMQRELARELAQVRASIAASAQALATRMDAAVASVLCAFDGQGIPGEPERLPTARIQAVMLKAIRSLKVKPEKGRLKDLARMGDLADLLARLMP